MKKYMIAIATLGFAGTALAQELVDADGNGSYSVEELTATYPDLTAETYAAIDANSDGVVDMEELTLAQESGLLPG